MIDMDPKTFSSTPLAALLGTIRRYGDYYTSGSAEMTAPTLAAPSGSPPADAKAG